MRHRASPGPRAWSEVRLWVQPCPLLRLSLDAPRLWPTWSAVSVFTGALLAHLLWSLTLKLMKTNVLHPSLGASLPA